MLLAFFMINANAINSISPDDFEKTIKEMLESKEKVDMINDYVDKLLKPEPTIDNCKKAKDFALQAAKIAEKLNLKNCFLMLTKLKQN